MKKICCTKIKSIKKLKSLKALLLFSVSSKCGSEDKKISQRKN